VPVGIPIVREASREDDDEAADFSQASEHERNLLRHDRRAIAPRPITDGGHGVSAAGQGVGLVA
jgi:hypothetical protein